MATKAPGRPRVSLYVLLWCFLSAAVVNGLLRDDLYAVLLAFGWALQALQTLTKTELVWHWWTAARNRQQQIDEMRKRPWH